MIEIGVSGFTDHPDILSPRGGLAEYAQTFPVVEVDSTAYGIRKQSVMIGWRGLVPEGFRFIIKATNLMTQHQTADRATLIQEFALFADSIAPLIETEQLATILFQFPPRFGATARNVRYLAWIRELMPTLPIAVEFRNPSWFETGMRDSTLELLADSRMSNVAVDEPQTTGGSIPLVPETFGDTLFVRLHGRNRAGWASGERSERTNYDYSDDELREIATACAGVAQNVCYIFNNNAGHAAARNAQRLQELLGVEFNGLAPKQMSLF
ncbi:DUF72 domain-containing protein [Lacticaseibacillus pabuli]|uniref:DUF72 domain-containing protein n=1 Tax=Lacticaseibacillus pabuli TaxID=3025672 RepID=A0ABY7WQ13_9LACO|nr:DUF72 domain-containing protein [Lacticaseibacillus sp. KACC 23028]WDF82290.1 DUF72 domain-containing protein [Lacticaseibacillus sp. KACC 23028]